MYLALFAAFMGRPGADDGYLSRELAVLGAAKGVQCAIAAAPNTQTRLSLAGPDGVLTSWDMRFPPRGGAAQTVDRFAERLSWLCEQDVGIDHIGAYVGRWLG
jgi:hypothetical protein